MRIDLVDRGIGVSQICPGAAETEFSMVRFKEMPKLPRRCTKGTTRLWPRTSPRP